MRQIEQTFVMYYTNLISRIGGRGAVSIILHLKRFLLRLFLMACGTDAVVYSLNLGAPRGRPRFMILRSINEIRRV